MSTLRSISSHIDTVRNMVKETSDDSGYSQEYLYKLLVDSRATILNQDISASKYVSHDNYQKFCMPMERGLNVSCKDCLPVEITCYGIEKIFVSKYKVPMVITGRYNSALKIYNIDSTVEISVSNPIKRSHDKYSKVNCEPHTYEIVNGSLYLFNANWIVVPMSGIFYDPTELQDIKVCNIQGVESGENCFNINTDFFPLDPTLNDRMYTLVLQKLGFSKQLPGDVTNDSKSEPSGF
jgi:hypothetical protein